MAAPLRWRRRRLYVVEWNVALFKVKGMGAGTRRTAVAWSAGISPRSWNDGSRNDEEIARVPLCRNCLTAPKCQNEEHHDASGNALPCVKHVGKITNTGSIAMYSVCLECGRAPAGTADSR